MKQNENKYPIAKAKGKHTKYTELWNRNSYPSEQ
jgi:hypothetical protein